MNNGFWLQTKSIVRNVAYFGDDAIVITGLYTFRVCSV